MQADLPRAVTHGIETADIGFVGVGITYGVIHEAMDSRGGALIFTVFDMPMGYFQVELSGETSDMCAFSTRNLGSFSV